MAITVTRTLTNLIGTGPSGQATIAANGTNTSTSLSHSSPAGVVDASIGLELAAGSSAPSTAVTITFQFSEDGTNFFADGPSISLTMANSTTYDYRYDPPEAALASRVVVTNGASNSITAWAQGSTVAVS